MVMQPNSLIHRLINIKFKMMKSKVFAVASVLLFPLFMLSCATLKTDPKSWTIMTPLASGNKLTVHLADQSAFNVEIENPTNGNLMIRQANTKDQVVVKNKISIAVLAGNSIEVLNVSKGTIKPIVRVYNHTAKVITQVTAIK